MTFLGYCLRFVLWRYLRSPEQEPAMGTVSWGIGMRQTPTQRELPSQEDLGEWGKGVWRGELGGIWACVAACVSDVSTAECEIWQRGG